MNRQIVAFLSLFSLALVLSIYYVMIPSGISNEQPVENPITEVADASSLFFEALILERDQRHEETIEGHTAILTSTEYTNAEKATALEAIENEKYIQATENKLQDEIKELGYPACFVEMRGDMINVLAYMKDATKQEQKRSASQIIFTVQSILETECDLVVEFQS